MWILISKKNPDEHYRLVVGKVYTVGRMDADITVPADKSISRKHATLEVTHSEANLAHPHKTATLTVSDLSKFGTAVDNVKLKGGSKALNNGSIIKFGTVDTCFTAHYEPVVVTTSCLDVNSKKNLKVLIGQLGGHVISEWRKECSLLVMTSLSVTVKVICALIQQKPIVTMKYIEDLVRACQAGAKPPDPDDYVPPLAESQLNPREVSFKKNPARASLFEGKTFIFLSTRQFKKLNVVVELAGGKPMLMEEGTDDDDDSILVAPDTVVMQCETSQTLSQNALDWASHVQDVMRVHNKRMIADSELGYAVLYCSVDSYCNPDSQVPGATVPAKLPSQSLSMQPDLGASLDPAESQVQPMPVKIKQEPISQEASKVKASSQVKGRSQCQEVKARSEVMESSRSQATRSQLLNKRKRDEGEDEDEENIVSPTCNKPKRLLVENSPSPTAKSRATRNSPAVHNKPEVLASESFMEKSRQEAPGFREKSKKQDREADFDLFDDFESTRRPKKSVATPASRHTTGTPAGRPSRGVKNEVDDLFDEFDEIASTRRRPKKTEEVQNDEALFDEFDNLPSTRKRKRNETQMDTGNDLVPEAKLVKQSPKVTPRQSQASRRPAKQEPRTAEPQTVSNRLALDPDMKFQDRSAILKGAIKTEGDPDLEVALVQQEFASLVVRQPKARKQSQVTNNGTTTWKGKVVKNFKKFRKTAAGSERLPRIIGGNDLVVHNPAQRRELDDWFEGVIQDDNEREEQERQADELFNFEPRSSRR